MACRWPMLAIVAALLATTGPGAAAATPTRDRSYLESELADIDARIAEANDLLRRIEGGGVYLVTNGMIVTVVTREQLVDWATDQLYRQGTGIGGGQDRQFVLRRVQQAVATSPRLIASLREMLRDDLARRQAVRNELASLGAAADSAPAAAVCSLPHSWRADLAGRGSLEVSADASGNVSGTGITSGRATLQGNRLTIEWISRSGAYEFGGRYNVTLDRACNGAGQLSLDIVPAGASDFGIRGGPVTFTSLGAGPS